MWNRFPLKNIAQFIRLFITFVETSYLRITADYFETSNTISFKSLVVW